MRPILRGAVPSHIGRDGVEQAIRPEDYKFNLGQLIARIGEYCSYCELPMGANLAIEHKRPKSVYPDAETDWDNFVLACANCNSRKGKGSYDVYWPDATYMGFNTFSMLEYYEGVADGDRVILVRYSPGSGADQDKVERTIDMVKLNNYVSPTNDTTMSDRRVWNRTKVWRTAGGIADKLLSYHARYNSLIDKAQAAQQANADQAIAVLKSQIKLLAPAAGFWSVWMTVFSSRAFISPTYRAALLNELFVQTFPGTTL